MKTKTLSLTISIGTLLYGIGFSSVFADQTRIPIVNSTENITVHDVGNTLIDAADIWRSIEQAEVSSASMPKPFLGNVDTYVFNSLVHQEHHQFQISVAVPRTYQASEKSYPVLYSMDANSEFGIVVETARLLAMEGTIPELIIVGVGFPVGGYFMSTLERRRFDYTPTVLTSDKEKKRVRFPLDQAGGGAPKLLEFMRQQLMPFIEKKYRAQSDDRAVFGHSLGGLFTTYALFQSERLFQRFILGSPSLLWDAGVMFKVEEEYAKAHTALPAKIFVSIADNEGYEQAMPDFNRFVKALEQHNYTDLHWTAHIFEGETHVSVLPATISRGLRTIYHDK